MKKYLPLFLIVLVGVFFVTGVFVLKNRNSGAPETEEEVQNVPDLPEDQKPILGLVPTSDGHYLGLKIEDIKVKDATSMDYELFYKANNGGNITTQGTSGTIKLSGMTSFNKDLLLGSESSGKFRYDKGVENGTVTLRFRNSSGKLLGKVSSDWHLQTDTLALSSTDGSFKYTLSSSAKGVWFVTMMSFRKPNSTSVVVFSNGWAIYASDGAAHAGK